MVARPREGPDLQKWQFFGAERADPASPAGLSVGTWERNGTKMQSKRQFLHLAMAVGAKLEPRASEAHWSQRRAIYGPPGAPAPPDRPETKGKEQPNEPLSKTPARPRDPNGHSPPRKTLTGSRRGPHRRGEGSPKKSREWPIIYAKSGILHAKTGTEPTPLSRMRILDKGIDPT